MNRKAGLLKTIAALSLPAILTGCQGLAGEFESISTKPRYTIKGPNVINNTTPVEPAFTCLADHIREKQLPQVSITVGNVKDFTGKYSESEGGSAITQGGALMVISALGKLGNTIALRERFDTSVADREFAFLTDQRLGDGQVRIISNNGQQQRINFLPKVGGTVQHSQVYIVGGITELNYNLSTGGASAEIAGIGPRVRQYTISVAADLRLVNTSNLNVVKSVSLQKQVVGYEIKAGVFKFFGDNLFNIEAGMKSQEPLQLAIRTVLEMATLELVSTIYSFDYEQCFDPKTMKAVEAEEPEKVVAVIPKVESPKSIAPEVVSPKSVAPEVASPKTVAPELPDPINPPLDQEPLPPPAVPESSYDSSKPISAVPIDPNAWTK